MRPKLLDLYSKAGGASMGYHIAGFEVVGVDIEPQPNYPFRFVQGDVLKLRPEYIRKHFQAVAASPPCQAYSSTRSLHPHIERDDLVDETRSLLEATGLPYVIENVVGAPLINPVLLCESSFGLRVRRHRLFETNWGLEGRPCRHAWQDIHRPYVQSRYHTGKRLHASGTIGVYGGGQGLGDSETWLWRVAMGIDWMTKKELSQAIPPAYTQWIGEQLFEVVS